MGTNVRVQSGSKNRISINKSGINQEVRTIAINSTTGGNRATNLTDLLDVNATSSDDGETLVWDEIAQKYVIKILPKIDGGVF